MAIENSIAGSIFPNYNLLQKSNLQVVGEIYLQIRQNLLVNPGVNSKIFTKCIHILWPFSNAWNYLDKYNWKLVETEDTALSAKHIHQHQKQTYCCNRQQTCSRIFQSGNACAEYSYYEK